MGAPCTPAVSQPLVEDSGVLLSVGVGNNSSYPGRPKD